MATRSSSRLKSVPEKLKIYFTGQDEEYLSSQETDVFFQENPERSNGTENKEEFVRSIVWWSITMFLSGIASHFCFSITCIKLYCYDFDNIVSTKIYSLDHTTNCDNKIRVSKTKEEGSLIYA